MKKNKSLRELRTLKTEVEKGSMRTAIQIRTLKVKVEKG